MQPKDSKSLFLEIKGSVITLVYKGSLWYVFLLCAAVNCCICFDATAPFLQLSLSKQVLGRFPIALFTSPLLIIGDQS